MNKIIKSLFPALLLIGLLVFLSSRNGGEQVYKRTQFIMGTFVEITVPGKGAGEKAEAAVSSAFSKMKELEGLLGRHQQGSDVWKINQGAGEEVAVSKETLEVVRKGLGFSKASGGAFNVAVGRLSELWSFEEERTKPPEPDEIRQALAGVGEANVVIDEKKGTVKALNGVHLDLGAIAKGFIIDRAGDLLASRGIRNFIINAGGDMIIRGKKGGKPWRIGVQHPRNPNEMIARIDAGEEETAIVTSGDYERFFIHEGRRYHHILDPATGYPASKLMSVTVKASDAVTADALSTALFVLGREKGLKLAESLPGVEVMIVDRDGNISLSEGFKKSVKINGPAAN